MRDIHSVVLGSQEGAPEKGHEHRLRITCLLGGSKDMVLGEEMTTLSKTVCCFLWKGILSINFKNTIGCLDLAFNK